MRRDMSGFCLQLYLALKPDLLDTVASDPTKDRLVFRVGDSYLVLYTSEWSAASLTCHMYPENKKKLN